MRTRRTTTIVLLHAAIALVAMQLVTAQLPWPQLRQVFPPGAQAGSTVEVTIGGSSLEETTELLFSHPGIRCERIMIAASEFYPERAEPLRYKITVAPDVPPGTYEMNARTRLGLTAPRAFQIGTFPEVVHTNNNAPKDAMPLPLGTVVNGHSDGDAIDHYLLELKQDQRVIIQCRAESIDSRMDATMVLFDSEGSEMMRDRDTIGRDAILDVTAPEEGVYLLHVFDFEYRGSTEFPYRLLASAAPHIDFIDPPAGQPGTTGKFKIYGRNLPGGSKGEGVRLGGHELETMEVEIELKEQSGPDIVVHALNTSLLPGMDYRLQANGLQSNAVRIGFAQAPVVRETEGEQSQNVEFPCEVHGRFDRRGDSDSYRFAAKKGVVISVTCHAESLNPATDPLLIVERITKDDEGNENGKEIASNDDSGSGAGGRRFPVTSHDPVINFVPAEDGTHRITLYNQSGASGPSARYRLVIRESAPEFDLVATHWEPHQQDRQVHRTTPLLRQGGSTTFRVFVMRRHGFRGDIVLTADGLPPGVTATPTTVQGAKDNATIVVYCAEDAPTWDGFITIKGTAGDTAREAKAGAISWAVPNWDTDWAKPRISSRLPLSVCASEKAPLVIQPGGPPSLEVELGGKLEIPVKLLKRSKTKGDCTIGVVGLPYTKGAPQLKIKEKDSEGKLGITFKKTNEFPIAPGEYKVLLRGQSIVKHRDNQAGVDKAEEERKRIEGLEKTFQEEAKVAKAAVDPARKALQEAEKNKNSASAEAKGELEKLVNEARTKLQETEGAAKAAEEKAKRATAEKNKAANRVKQANERAKERDVQHVTYSLPMTIVVKPAPPKEEGK